MNDEEKPQKPAEELYYAHDLLILACRREDCWLEEGEVKRWLTDTTDYKEVSAAVSAHQMKHIGRVFAKLLQGLK